MLSGPYYLVLIFVLKDFRSSSIEDFTKHTSWTLFDHEQCGESLADRIIGGSTASLGQYPWMALIGYSSERAGIKNIFRCGGVLISERYVVTAAHCTSGLAGDLTVSAVRLGEYYMNKDKDCVGDVCAPPVQDIAPEKIFLHEKYIRVTLGDDISLIRLSRPADLNEFVNPICLPYGPLLTRNYIGQSMEVAGWGVSVSGSMQMTDTLLYIHIPIIPRKYCERTFGKHAQVRRQHICAGGQVGKDSCTGDSGGPLMMPAAINGPPKYYLFGLVSYGNTECGLDFPAVYSNISYFTSWILDRMEP